MPPRRTNPDFQNGVPELLILKLLSRQEMYGYQLVRAITESTREALAYGEGSIYPVLHDLEARKLVKTRQEEVAGRVRSYYRMTRAGRKRFEELVSSFEKTVGAVRLVLEGENVSG
jgi:PadR family transcriptional regulator PadR